MKKCILARGTKPLRNGKRNPKDYPYWEELKTLLTSNNYEVLDLDYELPIPELRKLLLSTNIIIGVDSFIQHYCWSIKKPCIVLFGKSDPLIFGHKENVNILKDRMYLRVNQFDTWENESYNEEVFTKADQVFKEITIFSNELAKV